MIALTKSSGALGSATKLKKLHWMRSFGREFVRQCDQPRPFLPCALDLPSGEEVLRTRLS